MYIIDVRACFSYGLVPDQARFQLVPAVSLLRVLQSNQYLPVYVRANKINTAGLTSMTTTESSGASPVTPGPTPSVPPSTSSAPPSGGAGAGGGSSNTGVIAGSVVGGVAVLALAGVAVLWILKRHKKQPELQTEYASAHPQTPTPYHPPTQSDKPMDLQPMYSESGMSDVPEFVPPASYAPYGHAYANASLNSNGNGMDVYGRTSSPQNTHSPVPVYPDSFRGELSEVRSPAP
jgi:hypothetical protein